MLPAGKLDKTSRISLKTRCYTKPKLSQLNKLPPKRQGGREGGTASDLWIHVECTINDTWPLFIFKSYSSLPYSSNQIIKWVVQTRVLFPEILRNVTLAGIDFATADLQVNNCYNPSLASLPLPMTSHASVNDTQLEQQREVWNWSLFPHFSNKVNLQFLCETNKDVLCLGINKIFKYRAKIPSLILFHWYQ